MRNHKFILVAAILSGYGMVTAQGSSGGTETGGTLEKPPKLEQPSSPGSTPTATSHEIKRAEQALNGQGFNPGRIDGKIDSETKEALREFQKRNNLDITGELDKETAEKLGVLLGVEKGSSGQQPGKEGATPPTKEFSPQGRLHRTPGTQTTPVRA
jgi:peptidoglycan hydrolase-like protein with peptidoglycan-binding domain